MAYTIPEKEPDSIVAGDRAQWKRKDLSDFPADVWTLTYYLRGAGPGHQIDIAAVADGTNYEVDEAPTTTAGYIPGIYFVTAYVAKSGDRKHVFDGRIEIKINPVDVTQPLDGRSHARKILDAIDATLLNKATSDMQRYVFQSVGRSIDRIPIPDLIKLRDYWSNIVATEEAALGNGTAKTGRILVRFGL